MEIGETLTVTTREAWRAWLAAHHGSAREIWLLVPDPQNGRPKLPYLHAVEEALCFGWVDSIVKRYDAEWSAQRFSPRRPRSHWTELNKERARRLLAAGRMMPAGLAVLPDLSPESFRYPEDILAALRADPEVWRRYEALPELYRRIRVGYIEEMRRRPAEFAKRLAVFVQRTRAGKMYGQME